MLYSYRHLLQPCDRRDTVQPTMTYTDLPSGAENAEARCTCSHTHTHTHQRPHTQLCQQLILIKSNGPIPWPRKRTPTYYCQLICSFPSAAFLRRSHFIVFFCAGKQWSQNSALETSRNSSSSKILDALLWKRCEWSPRPPSLGASRFHVPKRFEFNRHSCNHIQQKRDVQLL